MNDWNHRSTKRDFPKNAQNTEESNHMEDITHPLHYLFAWYDGVVNEFKQAKDHIRYLNDKLEECTHETETIENLGKQLDLSREVSNCFERRVRELERDNSQQKETVEYFTGVAAEGLVTKVQLKEVEARLAAAEADVEYFRNQALKALTMSINPPVILQTDDKEVTHKLEIAQARIRVLEGELQDKGDNFKFLQDLLESLLKAELGIKERFAQMRAQIRTLEQERDEALDELENHRKDW